MGKNAVEYISCDLSSKLLILFHEHIEKQPECPKLDFSGKVVKCPLVVVFVILCTSKCSLKLSMVVVALYVV